MPQMDFTTFFPQVFWLILLSSVFFFFFFKEFFSASIFLLKMRISYSNIYVYYIKYIFLKTYSEFLYVFKNTCYAFYYLFDWNLNIQQIFLKLYNSFCNFYKTTLQQNIYYSLTVYGFLNSHFENFLKTNSFRFFTQIENNIFPLTIENTIDFDKIPTIEELKAHYSEEYTDIDSEEYNNLIYQNNLATFLEHSEFLSWFFVESNLDLPENWYEKTFSKNIYEDKYNFIKNINFLNAETSLNILDVNELKNIYNTYWSANLEKDTDITEYRTFKKVFGVKNWLTDVLWPDIS